MELYIPELQKYGSEILREVIRICDKENIPYQAAFGTLLGAIRHQGPIPWDYDIDIAVSEEDYDRFLSAMRENLPEKYWLDFRNDGKDTKLLARVGLKGYSTAELHVDVFRLIGVPDDPEEQKRFCKRLKRTGSFRCAKVYKYSRGKKAIQSRLIKVLFFWLPATTIIKWYDQLCKKYPVSTSKYLVYGTRSKNMPKHIQAKEELMDLIKVPYMDFEISVPRTYEKRLEMIYHDWRKFPPQDIIDRKLNHTYKVTELK